MNRKKFDFIESLVKVKDQANLEKSIIEIGSELIKEGFDYEDVCDYILIKVNDCLAAQR